jgi:hypothetical protein
MFCGRAIAQADSRLLPTAAARDQSKVRSCGIYGEESGTGTDSSPSISGFRVNYHSTKFSMIVSLGAGAIGQLLVHVPKEPSLTPHHEMK